MVSGLSSFTIPRIAANSNVSHTVVYRPKTGVWGQFNFTSAEVNYLPREESQDVQIGFTSEPGEGYIVSLKEFDRRFSPHIVSIIFSIFVIIEERKTSSNLFFYFHFHFLISNLFSFFHLHLFSTA